MADRPDTDRGVQRLGVFGGTFDPPHVGHLVAAVNTGRQLGLDEILFVVASTPWQKVGSRPISDATDRLAMVELATADRAELVPSALEIQRGGDSVTADTLEELQVLYPDHEYVVILGSDAAAGLDSWRRGDVVRELASIAVIDRPGTVGDRPPDGYRSEIVVECPLMDISSTDIRERVGEGLPIDYLVTDSVRDYIEARGLYTS